MLSGEYKVEEKIRMCKNWTQRYTVWMREKQM